MKELEVQKALRSNWTIARLKKDLGINSRRHKKYSNLVLLKYSQIASPMSNSIVQECRGIILDENNNWAVVHYGLKKFFNIGESLAAPLNLSELKIYEKIDDTAVSLYYHNNEWLFGTLGAPDANGFIGLTAPITFQELITKTWKDLNYKFPEYTGLCFTFGLTTPYNKIVVNHKESNLQLLAIRDLKTGLELPLEESFIYNWQCVKEHKELYTKEKINFKEAILRSARNLEGSKQEGYVVVDNLFNRVKVKSPSYVLLHRFKSSFSDLNLFELALINEDSETGCYFPEYKEQFKKYQEDISEYITSAKAAYLEFNSIFNQKEFALAIKSLPFAALLFYHRSKPNTSINELVRQSKPELIYKNIYQV